ncbi:MAG: hypothetical protein ACOC4M_03630 [Promethearchaeia archaeon]
MKPPICRICHERLESMEEGGLIYFRKRPSDIEWEKEMKKEGKVGHPPYADWFCEDHYDAAYEYKSLPIHEALQKLKEKEKNK